MDLEVYLSQIFLELALTPKKGAIQGHNAEHIGPYLHQTAGDIYGL